MAVPEETPYIEYVANGSTTEFALGFYCINDSELIVTINEIEPLVGEWELIDGYIKFLIAPPVNSLIAIKRNSTLSRTSDYQTYDNSLRPQSINVDFDQIWRVLQEFALQNSLTQIKFQELIDQLIEGNINGLPAEILARITGDAANSILINQEALRAYFAEQNLELSLQIEKERALSVETGLQVQVDSIVVGIKAYRTYALMDADKANIPINSKASVTADVDTSKNIDWQWNGVDFSPAPLNAVTQAKLYFDDKTGYAETSNIINPAQATTNAYFNTTGTVSNAAWVFGNEYIPVVPGQKMWMKGVTGGNTFQFYKADLTPIWHGVSTSIVNGIFTVPLTVAGTGLPPAFMRIATNLSTSAFSNGTVQVGYGDVLPDESLIYLQKFYYFKEDNFIDPILKVTALTAKEYDALNIKEFVNLVNPAQATTQGFFAGTGISGTGNPSFLDYYFGHDYYPAKVGDKFWMKGVTGGQVIQFCKADQSAIWNGVSQDIVNGIYTVPAMVGAVNLSATAFIRIGTNLGSTAFSSGKVAMGKGDVAPMGIPSFNAAYSEPTVSFSKGIQASLGVTASALNGKKLGLIGDSISNNPNCYAKVLADRHGAILTKYTADGARVHRESAEHEAMVMAEIYLTIPTANPPDIILIAGGTNDPLSVLIPGSDPVAYADHLGVFTDRTEYTFYGALHVLLSGLRSRFVDTRIGFLAPIPRADFAGTNMRYIDGDMTNMPYLKYKAIKEVCAYYSVPVWNGNTEFGASPLDSAAWAAKFMNDLLHPTVEGHIWYANRSEPFVLNLAK